MVFVVTVTVVCHSSTVPSAAYSEDAFTRPNFWVGSTFSFVSLVVTLNSFTPVCTLTGGSGWLWGLRIKHDPITSP